MVNARARSEVSRFISLGRPRKPCSRMTRCLPQSILDGNSTPVLLGLRFLGMSSASEQSVTSGKGTRASHACTDCCVTYIIFFQNALRIVPFIANADADNASTERKVPPFDREYVRPTAVYALGRRLHGSVRVVHRVSDKSLDADKRRPRLPDMMQRFG